MAQQPARDFAAEWKQVDAYLNEGLPQSARKEVEKIYTAARAQGLPVQVLKAQFYLLETVDQANQERGDSLRVRTAEQYARTEAFPYNAIWHSVAGSLYRNYYEANRWKIFQRTRTSTAPDDFEQWDATRLVAAMNDHFKASVAQPEALKAYPIERFDPILEIGRNTRSYRPTLYDLLAFRAVEYFSWEPKDLPQTAGTFKPSDPALLAPASVFMTHRFATGDTASPYYNAVALYQAILRTHANDTKPDAFLDADLERIEFANRIATLPEKKAQYEAALETISRTHATHPLAALAQYRLALSRWSTNPDLVIEPGQPKPDSGTVLRLQRDLQRIVQQFPATEGGLLAAQYLQNIQRPSLNLQAEEAVLPGKPSKVLLTYKAVPNVWLRIVRLNADYFRSQNREDRIDAAWLARQPSVKQWQVSLPKSTDLELHRAELKIDALPEGIYAIVYSQKETFSGTGNLLGYTPMTVTRLALMTQSGTENLPAGYVVDRENGTPVPGATVTAYRQQWENGRYTQIVLANTTTKPDGSFTLSNLTGAVSGIGVTKGADAFYNRAYLSLDRLVRDTAPQPRAFFFTDRSIYRPGQAIYFKAIALEQSDYDRKAQVLSGTELKITFYDANSQQLATQTLRTNAFGSVTGTFTAPQSGLTGNMRLEAYLNGENIGTNFVQVEEYKRPTFFVQPDSLSGKTVALNEPVTLTLKALSYAGAPLDGAQVNYRVVRQARIPYWFWGRGGGPSSPPAELTQGTTTARADGSFDVSFQTIPDASVPEKALPVFTYTVYADVSDLNGETHSAQQSVSASYRALELTVDLPQQAARNDLDSIAIRTESLSGSFLPATVTLTAARLQAPPVLYRKRLWELPDVFLMNESAFRADFPVDAYKDEDDYHNWPVAETVLQQRIATTKAGTVALPDVFRKNGWYVFTVSTTDKNGKAIEQKQYVHVWAGAEGGPIALPLMVVPQSIVAQPGDRVTVQVASAWPSTSALEQPDGIASLPLPKWISLTGTHTWTQALNEADRGGRSVQYLMVRDNRVYTETAMIIVPWTTKDLSLTWETHRDKVQPGSPEEWTLVVRGARQDKVSAELAAVLYDASLDAFLPHTWSVPSLFATHYPTAHWNIQGGFGIASNRELAYPDVKAIESYYKQYDALKFFGAQQIYQYMAPGRGQTVREGTVTGKANRTPLMERVPAPSAAMSKQAADEGVPAPPPPPASGEGPKTDPATVPLRKNLQETAFFMPQMSTDADGTVRLKFAFPDALTEWKLLAFAHTKDLKTGTLSGTVKTQKDLMVVPNLPRFFRQGDDLMLSAKITNMTAATLAGSARLELIDALTNQPLNNQFGFSQPAAAFTTDATGSTTVTWKLTVPRSRYEPVLVRISAASGTFTDGEENMLPVITNRTLVTETLPLWMNGAGTKTIRWDKLLASGSSNTLAQHGLTVEYTTNPAWYAIQALPYLMEYPYECSEQLFSRYYAAALAAHIVKSAPRVRAVLDRWQSVDTAALLSNLEKNEELKSALLEETPWVLEAQSETQQRKNVARLFETVKLARALDETAKKLEARLLPEGGFPWFSGDNRPDRYITQYIVTGIGRLRALGVDDKGSRMQRIADKCLPYLDRQLGEDYKALVKGKAKLTDRHIDYMQLQYLYMRTFFGKLPVTTEAQYYAGQAKKYWPGFNAFGKGLAGMFVQRTGDATVAAAISKSLLETSTYNEEMGRYWADMGRSWWWYEAPVETQSLLIEFFNERGQTSVVNEARRWLLKQKQTTHWPTTKATADACYALLRTGTEWLTAEPQVTVTLGDRVVSSATQKTEAGSGYFKTRIPGADVTPQMGTIRVEVKNGPTGTPIPEGLPTWGGVYWQYFEDYDKITAAQTPLQIRKQLWIEDATPQGLLLRPLTEGARLKVGDRVKARIELIVDRDMEYVHLKDGRASCFEPLNVLSGYKWQGGLGYYESTRDVSSNFFMSYLPKGKYVFEYPLFATQAGTFSGGLATIQCMYAPEFSAHTEGVRVTVSPR